jgi:uncharacterized protein
LERAARSSSIAVILKELTNARPDVRVLMLDVHNEYGNCFGSRASIVDTQNLKLPFWLFNFEEFTDALYGGRPAVMEELDILAELIPLAKGSYSNFKSGSDRSILARRHSRQSGFTVDTPAPYMIQDLVSLIDERMGKLENRATRMIHHRLMARIETIVTIRAMPSCSRMPMSAATRWLPCSTSCFRSTARARASRC